MHPYMPTCLHAYMPTYLHTYRNAKPTIMGSLLPTDGRTDGRTEGGGGVQWLRATRAINSVPPLPLRH